jgi:hypothetical protein
VIPPPPRSFTTIFSLFHTNTHSHTLSVACGGGNSNAGDETFFERKRERERERRNKKDDRVVVVGSNYNCNWLDIIIEKNRTCHKN